MPVFLVSYGSHDWPVSWSILGNLTFLETSPIVVSLSFLVLPCGPLPLASPRYMRRSQFKIGYQQLRQVTKKFYLLIDTSISPFLYSYARGGIYWSLFHFTVQRYQILLCVAHTSEDYYAASFWRSTDHSRVGRMDLHLTWTFSPIDLMIGRSIDTRSNSAGSSTHVITIT